MTGTLIALSSPLLPRPVRPRAGRCPDLPLTVPPVRRRRLAGTWCPGSPASTAPAAWPTGRSAARWAGAAGTADLTAEEGVVVIRRDPPAWSPAAPVLRPDPRGAAAALRAAPETRSCSPRFPPRTP